MRTRDSCYHLVYDTAGNVLDHSELFFGDLLSNMPLVQQMLSGMSIADCRHVEDEHSKMNDLVALATRWFARGEFDELFEHAGEMSRARWTSRAAGSGVLRLERAGEVGALDLLLSGVSEPHPPAEAEYEMDDDDVATVLFAGEVADALPDSRFERGGALQLVEVTRRPLLASVTWLPMDGDNRVVAFRTAERILAYAFFKRQGVVA